MGGAVGAVQEQLNAPAASATAATPDHSVMLWYAATFLGSVVYTLPALSAALVEDGGVGGVQ